MKSVFLLLVLAVAAVVVSCSSDGLKCGPGTREQAGECVVAGAGAANVGAAGAVDAGAGGLAGSDASAGAPEAGEGGAGGAEDASLIVDPLECGSRDITGATVVTAPITQDTTWSGVVYLPEGVSVRNEPTLTILPGTKVIVGDGASIELGAKGSHPKLLALGTASRPIKFCGETDSAGSWAGIVLHPSTNATSELQNVLISDGGSAEAGLVLELPIVLRGLQIRNSGVDGLVTPGFAEGSASLVITGSGGVPLSFATRSSNTSKTNASWSRPQAWASSSNACSARASSNNGKPCARRWWRPMARSPTA
jgi:hypothetical protein